MKRFLKTVVTKAFNLIGLEVRKSGQSRSTLDQVVKHVAKLGFKPATVIDVGVAYGTFDLYQTFPEAHHLLVEPLQEYESVLQHITRRYRADYVLAAAGASPGEITLNVHPDLAGSSIFTEAEDSDVNGIPRTVPMTTLDRLCAEKSLSGPYLIKIDVQGAELTVLDGASQILPETELVILEVSLFQFFVDGPQLYDVVSYMKNRGFVVYDIFGNHNRPLDGALCQVDMAFVKENGQFRKEHFFATAQQRQQQTRRLQVLNPKN
jgi:FkbM family methyltransferase